MNDKKTILALLAVAVVAYVGGRLATTRPAADDTKTRVRLAGGFGPFDGRPNAACPSCRTPLVIGEVPESDTEPSPLGPLFIGQPVPCPSCANRFDPVLAKWEFNNRR